MQLIRGTFLGIVLSTILILIILYFEFISNHSGIFTFLSVIIAVSVFLYNENQAKKRHQKKQLETLRNLLIQINFMAGKPMELAGIYRKSNLHEYKQSFNKEKIPIPPILQIDVNYYISNLDSEINKKSTGELKNILLLINDIVFVLNGTAERLVNLAYRTGISEDDLDKFSRAQLNAKQVIDKAIPKLEKLSNNATNLLIKEFNVKF